MKNKFKKNIKKVLVVYLIGMLLFVGNARYTYGFPMPPSAPSAPEVPAYTSSPPPPPDAPAVPEAPVAPSAPSAPTYQEPATSESFSTPGGSDNSSEGSESLDTNSNSQTGPVDNQETNSSNQPQGSPEGPEGVQTSSYLLSSPDVQSSGGEDASESMGSAVISTGNADNTGAIVNTGANNSLITGEEGISGGIVITSTGNGPDSANSGSLVVNNGTNSSQINSTDIVNNMNEVSDSGHNEANKNMGNATIETGDANVSGTIVNSVNTNVSGVMVSEFNIIDDHVGDVVLDFAGGCITNCGVGDTKIVNSNNGAGSENTGSLDLNSSDVTFQQNDANIENNMILTANTGSNDANKNMGTASITTGDANVSANVVNFVNNNIAGDVVYAVVNILGNLVGDIIIPESALTLCCGGSDITLKNSDNATDSTNTVNLNISDADLVNQFNNASIDNNLVYVAKTGSNELSEDMGGDMSIKSGNAEIVTQVLNIANTNILTGNAWLVIVNEAGKWIGHILGTDGGSNLAGSEGFEFIVNDAGDILAVNSGNGSGSTNTINADINNNDTYTQINNANIVNNINLTANTGNNEAEKNMDGASIETGDAKIVANIVNFVNNNVIGQGKLFVTVVNVFGSWIGDLLTPGYESDKDVADTGTGGGEDLPASEQYTPPSSNTNVNSGSGGNSGGSSSSGSQNTGSSTTVFASLLPLKPRVMGVRMVRDNEEEQIAEFKSISTDTQAITDAMGKKMIKINMAYALVILPLLLLVLFLRKRFVLHQVKAK